MGIRSACALLACMLLAACATSGKQQHGGSLAERKATLAHLQMLLSDERYAYRARPLDDRLSSDILDRWLSELDPDRLDFDPDDVLALDRFRFQLDDAIRRRDLVPVEAVSARHAEARRTRARHALITLAQLYGPDPAALAALESCESIAPLADTAPLDRRRRAHLLQQMQTLHCSGHARPVSLAMLSTYYTRMAREADVADPEQAFERFVDAWVKAVDHDGAYVVALPSLPEQASAGIGLTLRQQGPFIEIASVVPGGPAARSGQLQAGDRLFAIARQGGAQIESAQMDSVVGDPLADVVELLRGAPGSTVRLGIQPATGGVEGGLREVELIREQVTLAVQSATGTILERDGKRIGVVSPHGFYADLEAAARGEPDYRAVSRDVARLLEDMKREEVDGVLVDLRGVAGGSLSEVGPMMGRFRGFGLVMRVRKPGRITSTRFGGDTAVWDGPLLLLADADTASTAEMFAATIRDHGRGVVAGARTRGHGTVQTLINLARVPVAGPPGHGLLSLTTAEVYSPAGLQLDGVGVEPDVHLLAIPDGPSPQPVALPVSRHRSPRLLQWEPKPPAFDMEQLNARHRQRTGGPEPGRDPGVVLDQAVGVLLDMIDETQPQAAAAR